MATRRILAAALAAAFPFAGATARAAEQLRIPIGFEVLSDLGLLPLLKEGVVCRQHSSYDRTGGNDDGFSGTYTHVRKTDSGELVIFDADGPGCICRFWSAMPPEGNVKLFFDGEAQPRLTSSFREMLQNKVPPFAPPLTGQSSRGWCSYHPITFAKNCTIITEKQTGFLAIAYHKFPKDTNVVAFSPTLSTEQNKAYDAVQAHFADPSKREADAGLEMKWVKIPVGDGEFKLAELRGPATILALHMRVKNRSGRACILVRGIFRRRYGGSGGVARPGQGVTRGGSEPRRLRSGQCAGGTAPSRSRLGCPISGHRVPDRRVLRHGVRGHASGPRPEARPGSAHGGAVWDGRGLLLLPSTDAVPEVRADHPGEWDRARA